MDKENLIKGIKRCLENATLILDSSNKILTHEKSIFPGAYIQTANQFALGLYTYAIEEYGKAVLLKNYLKEDKKKYSVNPKIFGAKGKTSKAHGTKFDVGINALPIECSSFFPPSRVHVEYFTENEPKRIQLGSNMNVTVNATGTFEDTSNAPSPEDVVTSDFATRKDCFYVDWDDVNNCWREPPIVSDEEFAKGIIQFKKHIQNFDI